MTTYAHPLPAPSIVIESWLRDIRYRYPRCEIVAGVSVCGGFMIAEVRR
jgi:hypothetical protein